MFPTSLGDGVTLWKTSPWKADKHVHTPYIFWYFSKNAANCVFGPSDLLLNTDTNIQCYFLRDLGWKDQHQLNFVWNLDSYGNGEIL